MSRSIVVGVAVLCSCLSAQVTQEYELNDVNSSVTISGVSAALTTPAITTTCPGAPLSATLSSQLIGNGWEVGIGPAAMVTASQGALQTPNGQIVNLDILMSPVTYLWGGLTPDFGNPFPTSSFPIPFVAPPSVGSSTFQMAVENPGHPDGFSLSQCCQLDRNLIGTPAFPSGDDVTLTIPVGPGTCLSAPTFYGTSYTTVGVTSNGRMTFGPPSSDFSPSIGDALAGAGFFGLWTDFNPNIGGFVDVGSPALNQVRATWNNVPFYGEPTTANNFTLTLDLASGVMTIDGLTGVDLNPVSNTTFPSNDTQFLGVTAGAVGATDGGATLFAAGVAGAPVGAMDMIYDWFTGVPNSGGGTPSLLAGTLNSVVITPVGASYAWQGF